MKQDFISEEYLLRLQSMELYNLIVHLRQINCLVSSLNCTGCGLSMNEHASSRTIDKVIFKCKNNNCIKKTTTSSIRKGSFFDQFNKPLIIIIQVIHMISVGCGKMEISRRKNLSANTVRTIHASLVQKMKSFFDKFPIKLGGPNVICQCDETLLSGKRKYNVGSEVSSQTWVFAIVDTSFSPARGYATVVPDRSASTLLPIINSICLPGTIIHSDQWAAYRGISRSFTHSTVNHKYNFVDVETGTHTQNIESYNNKLKIPIKKMKGIKKTIIDSYLIEFMWNERNKVNTFNSLLNLIKIVEKE